MECFLPPNAFVKNKGDDNVGDSTKCVEVSDLGYSSNDISDAYTPICNAGTNKGSSGVNFSGIPNYDQSVNKNVSHFNEVEVGTAAARVPDGCKSPSMSPLDHLMHLRGEFSRIGNPPDIPPVDEFTVSIDAFSVADGDSKSPTTITPVKSVRSSSRSLDVLNSMRTRLDEPHVNISDDETKNPVLANSVRRTRGVSSDTAEVRRSLQVLGSSRCWTDRYEDDALSVTQSPVRSLSSLFNSQAEIPDASVKRRLGCTPNLTPIRSIRSFERLPEASGRDSLDNFLNTRVFEMSRMPYNPMCNVVLTKEQMCRARLSGELGLLYKHFQNLCTVINRSLKRNDKPFFRIFRVLVQRLSRRSFTLDHLRRMIWLAPNLISLKWVLISDSFRKRYPAEYCDSSDTVYDISVRILRSDLSCCFDNHDYENACFRFKTILSSWSLKCDSDKFEDFEVPMAELPQKGIGSNYSTPIRDPTPMSVTPVRSCSRPDSYQCLNTTPCKSFRVAGSDPLNTSSKRMRTLDSMSPMSLDLLDTPGMRRIRENARRIADEGIQNSNTENDLKFWIDMRWFTRMLFEIIVTNGSPVMNLEYLVDFIVKYGSRKVTQEQVTRWINTLTEIDPCILYKTVSKFEDYSTVVTINKSASLDNAVDYINQKIKTLKSF